RPSDRDRSFRAACRCSAWPTRLCQRLLDCRVERAQAGGHVGPDMNTKRPPVALRQDLKVAPRLRRLDQPKRIFLPADLQIPSVVTRHLKEDAGVGATFV